MASDFWVEWQFSQRVQLFFFCFGSSSTPYICEVSLFTIIHT
jgi:hypothetical protein